MNSTFEEFLAAVKARRDEDNYSWTDEQLLNQKEYLINCWKTNLGVYKTLEFMWFTTEEAKENFKNILRDE